MSAAPAASSCLSEAMEKAKHWILSQNISADIVVQVGDANFPLHKFMLVAKSGRVRRSVMASNEANLGFLDLSDVPGGAEAFEKAARFCYGINFEISPHNVAALRCAAEYLEMTDRYCSGNLTGRAEEFLAQVALKSVAGAVAVLRSCEGLLPAAENVGLVRRCVDVIGSKAFNETHTLEFASLGTKSLFILLRAAASLPLREVLENRIAAVVDQASAEELLAVGDLGTVRRIVTAFVERESATAGRGGLLYGGGGGVACSAAMERVAKLIDVLAAEIATNGNVTVARFAEIAGAVPKAARRFDDDLYRAVDIYLKAHPELDEIEREKVCSVMDPMRLSHHARLHATQNRRLPVTVVLHVIYFDRLKLRSSSNSSSGGGATAGGGTTSVIGRRSAVSVQASDAVLARENALLRTELAKTRMLVSDMQKAGAGRLGKASTGKKISRAFLAAVSRSLGRLNPFRHGTEKADSLNVDGRVGEVAKPWRRWFPIS